MQQTYRSATACLWASRAVAGLLGVLAALMPRGRPLVRAAPPALLCRATRHSGRLLPLPHPHRPGPAGAGPADAAHPSGEVFLQDNVRRIPAAHLELRSRESHLSGLRPAVSAPVVCHHNHGFPLPGNRCGGKHHGRCHPAAGRK